MRQAEGTSTLHTRVWLKPEMQSAFFLGLLRAGSLWPFPTFPWLNNSLIWFLISQSKACNEQCLAMFLDTGCIHFSINAACQAASLEDSLHQAKQLHKRSTNMYQWRRRHKKPFFWWKRCNSVFACEDMIMNIPKDHSRLTYITNCYAVLHYSTTILYLDLLYQ